MKFLCPSCKAKYQIADEKVAGRSVRMKCRKCGHVIQVSSIAGVGDALAGSEPPPPPSAVDPTSDTAATPDSVVPAPPDAAPVPSAALSVESTVKETPPTVELPEPPAVAVPPPPRASIPRASLTGGSRPGEIKKPLGPARPAPSVVRPSTSLGVKVPAAPFKAALPAKPPTPPPRVAPKSSPVHAAPSAATPLAVVSEAQAAEARDASPLPPVAPKPIATATAVQSVTTRDLPPVGDEDESTRIADAGALAGAFSLAVGAVSEAPASDAASMPADEWFVGINGVPVGPIRLSELRSKAASGSISPESLVWRDGFEDWRPLRTFPELLAIVDEGLSSMRASLTPFTPPAAPFGLAAASAAATAPLPAVIPITSDPFAGSGTSGVTSAAVVTDESEGVGYPKRSGSSMAAWFAVAMALLFGLTIGFVLFRSQPGKPIEVVKYVDRPVPGAVGSAAAGTDPKATAADETAVGDKNAIKHVSGTTAKSAGAPAASSEPDKGLSGLKGLSSLGSGPKGPDTAGPSGAVQGTGQLDNAQLQGTVARYTGSVKRACWQPALDTRDKDAPTTARVNVAITVLPSGSVQSATVGADPRGYRGLAQCISSRVRGWQFPPSGDSTTVNVPFVFAAQ